MCLLSIFYSSSLRKTFLILLLAILFWILWLFLVRMCILCLLFVLEYYLPIIDAVLLSRRRGVLGLLLPYRCMILLLIGLVFCILVLIVVGIY